MKLYLYRICTRQLTTDGVLKDENGVKICDTAENTLSMLPEGTYKVVLKKHRKLGHRAPCLSSKVQENKGSKVSKNTSPRGGREGALIHGNGVHGKSFGSSIIVGEHLVSGVVIHSYPYFERLVKRMEKVFKRGGIVDLVVIGKSL